MLGVFADVKLADLRVTLRAGHSLVIPTRIEARDGTGDQFGLTRLARLLATSTGRSAPGVARRLELVVLDHRGDQSVDDLAIVVLRARP